MGELFQQLWHPPERYRDEPAEGLHRNLIRTIGYFYSGALVALAPILLAIGVTVRPLFVATSAAIAVLASLRFATSHELHAHLLLFNALLTMGWLLVLFRELPSIVMMWLPVFSLCALMMLGQRRGTSLSIVALLGLGVLLSYASQVASALDIDGAYVPSTSHRSLSVVVLALAVGMTVSLCRSFMRFLDELRRADHRHREFLALLSHELRSPLAPIENSLYVLDHTPPGEDRARRARAVIQRQLAQLVRLIDDLLDVTRLANDKLRLRLENLDLSRLARSTLEDHTAQFETNGISLELDCSDAPIRVVGDRARIAQIIGNLLNNAAKFTGRGGHTTLALRADTARHQAILRVTDTGVGMDEETLRNLFHKPMQSEKTVDRSHKGLGLGLVLVRRLAELQHGSVSACSEGRGKGTEIEVRLPLANKQAQEETPPIAPPQPSNAAQQRVLIVEDDVDTAESLLQVLELLGYQAMVAHDSVDGLARARQEHPNVVLCDIGLPGMDGYEFARRIRADVTLSDVRLAAISGYALPEDREKAAKAGFDEHLSKPVDLRRLETFLANE